MAGTGPKPKAASKTAAKGKTAPTTKRANAAFENAQKRIAAREEAAAQKEAAKSLLAEGTNPEKVDNPAPRDTPAPADPAPQAGSDDAQRPNGDQPEGHHASLVWIRSEKVAEVVPHPRYTADELKLSVVVVEEVREQLAVLQACADSLAAAEFETASAVLIGSDSLLEEFAAAATMLANEQNSAVVTLMIGGEQGRLLQEPLKWSGKCVKPSQDALEHLQAAVRKDLVRFGQRYKDLLAAAKPSQTEAPLQGTLSLLPKKRKRTTQKATALAEATLDIATVVDLTQADQLAAMARRGRHASGEAGDAPAEGGDGAGASPGPRRGGSVSPARDARGRGRSAERVDGRARALSPVSRREQAWACGATTAPAAARGHAGTADARRGSAAARGAAGTAAAAGPPLAEPDRPAPAHVGGVTPYGRPPRVGQSELGALAEALRRSNGETGPGAYPADHSDDLDQELIGGRHSVLDQMRRSVPTLEHCLPLYQQLERQQAREAHAIATKTKLLKHATYALDLHLFQLATAQYRERYLSYSPRAAAEHVEYVLRLSQHWANRKCATLLKYDQAVREHVYLNTLTFAAATETQELWLRIVLPDVIRAAGRPQTGGGRADRSGKHGEGVVDSCGYFLSPGGCPHARAQLLTDAST